MAKRRETVILIERKTLNQALVIFCYQITSFSNSPSCLEFSPILDLILELADGFVYLRIIAARVEGVHLNNHMPV